MKLEKATKLSDEQQLSKQLMGIDTELEKLYLLSEKVDVNEYLQIKKRINQLTVKRSAVNNRMKRLTNQDYRRRQDAKCEFTTIVYDGAFSNNTFMSHGNQK